MLPPGKAVQHSNVQVKTPIVGQLPKVGIVLLQLCTAYRDKFDNFRLTEEYWTHRTPKLNLKNTPGPEFSVVR